MRKAVVIIALAGALGLSTASPGIAGPPNPPHRHSAKHDSKKHKPGNSGHEGRAPGAGHSL
jgi:hypothetical protein